MRKRRTHDPDHAEHIDLEHMAPFVERVGLDRALSTDAGVVDDDIDAAHRLGRMSDGIGNRGVVGDVGAMANRTNRRARRIEIDNRHHGTTVERRSRHRATNARMRHR